MELWRNYGEVKFVLVTRTVFNLVPVTNLNLVPDTEIYL